MRNYIRYAARLLPWLLVLTSCRGNGVVPTDTPAPTPTPKPPIYALIVKEKTNPYMLKMYEGFAAACEEIGAVPIFEGPSAYTANAQIEIIERLVDARSVDAIAIAANDADALEPSLQAAMAAGISVLSLDSSVNPGSRMTHIQQASPELIGRVLIQAAWSMTDGHGKVGLISSTLYATNQNLWISWMLKEIEENPLKYRDFELLPVLYGDDDPDKSTEAALSLLRTHSDLKAIITPSVVGMLAVGRVLETRSPDVVFTGLGLPSEIASFIRSGHCPWMYLWNPIDIGYLAAWSAHALHADEITGAVGDILTAGRLGQRFVTVSADGGTEILLGDPVKFDSDNIGEWELVY
ncbi:MAG: substrate-binding domain-containing protein [Oscillospiraceae bacterium]|nr:substrate-binding domain-containing protein [Oscillospiraceae bacterium]